jgi:PDZ domain-containing protein
MTRRATTLVVALVMLVALLAVGRFLTVPYVILEPGPVTDTLGNVPSTDTTSRAPGGPVISITGATPQATTGHLDLTTVESLPCGDHPSLWSAVKAWFDDTEAVVPAQVECPPGVTSKQDKQQNARAMSESQLHAVVAAFNELGYHSTGNRVEVASVKAGVPAAGVLRPGDVIETVNGKQIHSVDGLVMATRTLSVGHPIDLTVRRGTSTMHLTTTTIRGTNGQPMFGITARTAPTFNGVTATIGIDPDVIGGPSAGTALALGIIDKLTPGGLTGGRTIAGTGTVSPTGKVGEIGGIQQKIVAASRAHASVFFAPAGQCRDARAAAPASLTIVAVRTLRDAVTSLQALKAGSTNFPHC